MYVYSQAVRTDSGSDTDSDDEVAEPIPIKKKKRHADDRTAAVQEIKDKVRALALQSQPSESLILMTLDELSRTSRKYGHKEADTFDELYRQASKNQGKINMTTLILNVLSGNASSVVTKALSKCLQEKSFDDKMDTVCKTTPAQKPDMSTQSSPLANVYSQFPSMQQPYGSQQFFPFSAPYSPGYFRPRGTASSMYPRPLRPKGPCHFCDIMGHQVKDCEKLKAMKRVQHNS